MTDLPPLRYLTSADVVAAMPPLAERLAETPMPTDHELRLIREQLDPEGNYTT